MSALLTAEDVAARAAEGEMMSDAQRYYLHGDIVQDDDPNPMAARARATWPGKTIVFCAFCDWFADSGHALDCHETRMVRRGSRMTEVVFGGPERLLRDAKYYCESPAAWRRKWTRDSHAPNVFIAEETDGLRHIAGRVVCARCLGRAKWGWAVGLGSVALVTCGSAKCAPRGRPWVPLILCDSR